MSENFTSFNGDVTEVYSKIPRDYSFGMERREGAKSYRFVQATGVIANNKLVKTDTATALPYNVVQTAGAPTDFPCGVNESGARAIGDCFWMTNGGLAQVSITGTIAANDPISNSGTTGVGQKAPFTGGTVQEVVGFAVQAQASGTAVQPVFLIGMR